MTRPAQIDSGQVSGTHKSMRGFRLPVMIWTEPKRNTFPKTPLVAWAACYRFHGRCWLRPPPAENTLPCCRSCHLDTIERFRNFFGWHFRHSDSFKNLRAWLAIHFMPSHCAGNFGHYRSRTISNPWWTLFARSLIAELCGSWAPHMGKTEFVQWKVKTEDIPPKWNEAKVRTSW